jgi:hypothetical protein
MDSTATIPSVKAAEEHVIGCLVRYPERADEIMSAGLRPSDFVHHGKLFAAFVDQHQRGAIDPPLVGKQTGASGDLLLFGENVATTAHVAFEARKIIDAREKRQLLSMSEALRDAALNGHTADDAFREHKASLDDFEREREAKRPAYRFSFADLRSQYRTLKPALIDGLIRFGEVINIISNPKVGKSWFSYYLALCVITGRPLFDRFATIPARVLIIDNELHAETLSHRIPLVADAVGIDRNEYESDLDVWTLRGNLRSLNEVAFELERLDPQTYGLIIFDAKYRFAIAGSSENDNAAEAQFYNRADRLAQTSGAAIAFIHHASKGSQSDKRVSDVGSGAGTQSRAADVHAVFREHEDNSSFVFEALVRSFAPVEPIGLRWIFPLWTPDIGVDPTKLKRRIPPSEQRQADRDREGINEIVKGLMQGPATARTLRRLTGLGPDRQQRLLDKLESEGQITATEKIVRGNPSREYQLTESA